MADHGGHKKPQSAPGAGPNQLKGKYRGTSGHGGKTRPGTSKS